MALEIGQTEIKRDERKTILKIKRKAGRRRETGKY
jgi:hypothetical protein